MKHTVNSEASLSELIGLLRSTFRGKKYYQVTIHAGKARSLNQNAIGHAWYLQVSREEAEYTPGDVKCLCKYAYALPILRGDDAEYNAACEKVIDVLLYEDRIKAMEYWPATSLMNTKQKTEYLEAVQRHYAARVNLEFPE